MELGKPGAALQSFNKMIEKASEEKQLRMLMHNLLGTTYLQMGVHSKADEEFNESLKENQNNFHGWLNKAVTKLRTGEMKVAKRALEHAIQLNDASRTAHLAKVHLLYLQDRTDESLELCDDLLLESNDDILLMTKAFILLTADRLDEAEDALGKVREKSAEHLNLKGIVLMRKGRGKEARQYFKRALALNEDFSDAENNLLQTEEKLSSKKESEEQSMKRGLEALLVAQDEKKCPRCEALGSIENGICVLCGYVEDDEIGDLEDINVGDADEMGFKCPSCGFFLGEETDVCPACEAKLNAPSYKNKEKEARHFLLSVPGVGPNKVKEVMRCGYRSLEDIRGASLEELTEVPGVSVQLAKRIMEELGE